MPINFFLLTDILWLCKGTHSVFSSSYSVYLHSLINDTHTWAPCLMCNLFQTLQVIAASSKWIFPTKWNVKTAFHKLFSANYLLLQFSTEHTFKIRKHIQGFANFLKCYQDRLWLPKVSHSYRKSHELSLYTSYVTLHLCEIMQAQLMVKVPPATVYA